MLDPRDVIQHAVTQIWDKRKGKGKGKGKGQSKSKQGDCPDTEHYSIDFVRALAPGCLPIENFIIEKARNAVGPRSN